MMKKRYINRIFLVAGVLCVLFIIINNYKHDQSAPGLKKSAENHDANTDYAGMVWNSFDKNKLGKHNLLFFSRDYCFFCKTFLEVTKEDAEIKQLLSNYNLFMVKKEKDRKVEKMFKIRTYPSFIIIDDNMNILRRVDGYPGKNFLVSFLEDINNNDKMNSVESEKVLSIIRGAVREKNDELFLKWAKILKDKYPRVYERNKDYILPVLLWSDKSLTDEEKSKMFVKQAGFCNEYAWVIDGIKKREELIKKKDYFGLTKVYAKYFDCKNVQPLPLLMGIEDILEYGMGKVFQDKALSILMKKRDIFKEVADAKVALIYYKQGNVSLARDYASHVLTNISQYSNDEEIRKALIKIE